MTARILGSTAADGPEILADPNAYTDPVRMHETLAALRASNPVAWVDTAQYRPFWAITKHADVLAIERANDVFVNGPRPVLMRTEQEDMQASAGVRTLIHLDDPQHRDVRAIGANWFRPKAMRMLADRAQHLAKRFVDTMAAEGPECDFVQQVAVNYPLYMIMTLLGVPESDFGFMLRLTQELVGSEDSEFQRSATDAEQMTALLEMFEYFTALTAARRANPTEDLASAIANATINGEPLGDIDTVSYYLIIATAGHDTTSAVISGGMHALVEHPEQRERLHADPGLMGTATEEMIRWVSPVTGMMRTATTDTAVRGVPISAGESVLLSYVSANRDEDVFSDSDVFDVGRDPNRHLAFGHGVHFCLGAALARLEINSFFSELIPRLASVELAGTPELTATTFVGGLKHLPIRYRVK
ncbi:cytochrome P450 [Mycolicibacterium fortuitum]|uniref:Steroid C26-monooxygenase n=1 Tax=Mycolicibacterium fortuitum subsp. fortuitum DSM 46621 = ATCC 6841 = JCM 6387 TaxID=1214102 RepID=K0VF91_MYCFO|nr:cytochrome P450 [Mycolicibacterium fortuitum]AIY46719.1 putative cytochrome P450 hydroxylase [Mycobacterium sp. VKM Ac-1817D]CRL79545.1 cytochrome P450-terp [Mycolicibacter nonchromogenicus]EJZ09779.1 cytochrome P450-terp [Mycolicibacterium fortuitum subsp. fortuitum DSM 46621 = ATCC 6841 = JCM 6387]WEV30168.1 cytochrome P450 [Mycolicibacterium fortuitum]CRL57609.1 cytochrome P450-terp [Mycolicibacterium fortuitum subsp. fortuitum DSM 46621 = ATCC 6841 = JCM 6387]